MTTELFPTSKQLNVSEEEKNNAKVFIKDYLKKVKNVQGNLTSIINGHIKACIDGWPTAPDTFRDRILARLNIKADLTLRPGPLDNKTPEERKQILDSAAAKRTAHNMTEEDEEWRDLKVILSKSEHVYMEERIQQYKADFDLNDSSDVPIIRAIILEEIIQRRIQTKALQASRGEVVEPNITKLLTDSYDRIQKAQELLGISGRQRIKKMTNSDGSIAELNDVYINTLQEFPELETKWEGEEIVLLLRKYIRGELRDTDFQQLCPGNLTVDDAKERYNELIERGILDKVRDSLDKDNFGRMLENLTNHNYQPLLQNLVNTEDNEDINKEVSDSEDLLKELKTE